MAETMKVTDPTAEAVKAYAERHDMTNKDALARMLSEADYDV